MEKDGAICEGIVFLEYFRDLPDPRQAGKVVYPLEEIVLLCLLAVLAGAETFTDIARFGTKKLALLRRFRPFRDGTPAHDHLGDIFATLDAEKFQRCFVAWVSAVTGAPPGIIAVDGKTARRSGDKKGAKAAVHMVSAFAARQRLVLGQVKVAEKSNEIVAIPKLLEMMAIEGAIVTIDAMGCQRGIAKTIIDKKADYVLARRRRRVRRRAESQELPGHGHQPAPDGRWRSRTHRDPNDNRDPRCRLAPRTPQLAGIERDRHGREPPRNRRQNRTRNPLLHHIPAAPGRTTRRDHPQPLGRREQPALGLGHDLSRR
jgi:hypothetical protein